MRALGAAYQVSYIVYPPRLSGAASADIMLDTFRNNMSTGHSYRNETRLALGRFSGRQFTVVRSPTRTHRRPHLLDPRQALPAHGHRRARHRRAAGHPQVLRLVRAPQGVTKRRPYRAAPADLASAARKPYPSASKKHQREEKDDSSSRRTRGRTCRLGADRRAWPSTLEAHQADPDDRALRTGRLGRPGGRGSMPTR